MPKPCFSIAVKSYTIRFPGRRRGNNNNNAEYLYNIPLLFRRKQCKTLAGLYRSNASYLLSLKKINKRERHFSPSSGMRTTIERFNRTKWRGITWTVTVTFLSFSHYLSLFPTRSFYWPFCRCDYLDVSQKLFTNKL